MKDRQIVGVDAVLDRITIAARPGIFAGGIEGRPGEVQPGADDLGLQPGQLAQALRIALEAAAFARRLVQRHLAVVAERRVAEIVRQAGGIDDVRIGAEPAGDLPADLGALQRMGQPGARNAVFGLLVDPDHLGLGRQPAQRRRMQHASPVALVRTARGRSRFGRLGDPAFAVRTVCGQRVSLPDECSRMLARPASRRATGTRNGEQET